MITSSALWTAFVTGSTLRRLSWPKAGSATRLRSRQARKLLMLQFPFLGQPVVGNEQFLRRQHAGPRDHFVHVSKERFVYSGPSQSYLSDPLSRRVGADEAAVDVEARCADFLGA